MRAAASGSEKDALGRDECSVQSENKRTNKGRKKSTAPDMSTRGTAGRTRSTADRSRAYQGRDSESSVQQRSKRAQSLGDALIGNAGNSNSVGLTMSHVLALPRKERFDREGQKTLKSKVVV
jgi:hypothetical protein